MTDKKVEILHREVLFQGFSRVDRLHLRQELFRGGWSEPFSREVFRGCEEAAEVLLFDPRRDKVVMIKQLRAGPIARQDRTPCAIQLAAGMVDPGETPDQTARREAMEEAGCNVTDLQKIYHYYGSPGNMSQRTTLFVGRTLAPEEEGQIMGLTEENEDIKVVVLDAAQAISLLYTGALQDASSIIAMQWFSLNHTELRSRWLMSETSSTII